MAEDIIELTCRCGCTLRSPASRAGRRCRCPECGAELRIPGGEGLLTVEDAGVREVGAPAAGPKGSCPTCGAKLSPDSVICVQCGTNVETGERLGGGARDLLTVDERLAQRQQVGRLGFATLVWGTLATPWATIPDLRWQLSFGDQLIKMTLFWVASLAAVGALGALQEQTRPARSEGPVRAQTEPSTRTIARGRIDGVGYQLSITPARFMADRPVAITLHFKESPPAGTFQAAVWPRGQMPTKAAERRLTAGEPLELPVDIPPDCEEVQLVIRQVVEGEEDTLHPSTHKVFRPAKQAPRLERRSLALGALVRIGEAVGVLLLWGVLLGIGGTVMAGRADWVPLFVLLAFLQAVTNLGWIPFLPLMGWLGPSHLLVLYVLLFWKLLLYFHGIVHLYELDARNGAILVFFAGGVIEVGKLYVTQGQSFMAL